MVGLETAPEWRPERLDSIIWGRSVPVRPLRTAICGSYTKFGDRLERDLAEFSEFGVQVLSPKSAHVDSIHDGFAHLAGDVSRDERTTEDSHLDAISKSDFLWVMNKEGFLGLSTAFEMGFATALGIPIHAHTKIKHNPLGSYAHEAGRPRTAQVLARRAREAKNMVPTLLLDPSRTVSELAGCVDAMQVLIASEGLPLSVLAAERLRGLARKTQKLLGTFGA